MSQAPKPPNYRPQTQPDQHCGNCEMYDDGLCWGYGNFPVEANYVCDSWAPESRSEVQMSEQRRDFSQAERDKLAKSGAALPDGSFPIVTAEDLKNAIQAVGRASDKVAAVAHIKKRAKALGASDLIPEDWRAIAGLPPEGSPAEEEEETQSQEEVEEQGGENTGACSTCEGLGVSGGENCPTCDGTGKATETVGGQQQNAASPELEKRKARFAMLEGTMERRSFAADVELRKTSSGGLKFTGYASVTETPYEVMDFQETIARGAFKRTLADKAHVVFLINHEDLPLASTESGTMTLTEDVRGLKVDAEFEPTDPDVQRIVPKLARGDLKEMSFAFRATQQDWDEGRTNRLIREVTMHRGDVSLVTHGANSATSASLRSAELRSEGVAEPVEVVSKPLRRSNVEWAKGRRAKHRRSR